MPDLPKFVPLEHVMDELSISRSQAYALVRGGDLKAIQVGGRGQWRISLDELEVYIERAYAETDRERGLPSTSPASARRAPSDSSTWSAMR